MGLDVHYSEKPYKWYEDGEESEAEESWYDDSEHFRAGSYSGYNQWREHLSLMALGVSPRDVWDNPNHFSGKPFVLQINFTDCDGVHHLAQAEILAKDYTSHQEKAEEYSKTISDGEWFLRLYNEWRKAYETAARGGSVLYT